jgi:hypothetical protein
MATAPTCICGVCRKCKQRGYNETFRKKKEAGGETRPYALGDRRSKRTQRILSGNTRGGATSFSQVNWLTFKAKSNARFQAEMDRIKARAKERLAK